METSLALKATHLEKRYGSHQAVDKVSLSLPLHKCLALLGPNGAGKTTVCEMLEGLIAPDGGRIEIFGLDLATHLRRLQHDMGVQLQETVLYRRYTVRETLKLFASFYKKTWPLKELLQRLELEHVADKYLHALSGGERQRAYLATSLVHKPRLLFLDEPTTGLDPAARRGLWKLLKELRLEEGLSILLTTHAMEEAQELADEIAILQRGKLLAQGSWSYLATAYGTTEQLCFDPGKDAQAWCQKFPWLKDFQTPQGFFEIRANALDVPSLKAKAQELLAWSLHQGLTFENFELRRPRLEDIYLSMTQGLETTQGKFTQNPLL